MINPRVKIYVGGELIAEGRLDDEPKQGDCIRIGYKQYFVKHIMEKNKTLVVFCSRVWDLRCDR